MVNARPGVKSYNGCFKFSLFILRQNIMERFKNQVIKMEVLCGNSLCM